MKNCFRSFIFLIISILPLQLFSQKATLDEINSVVVSFLDRHHQQNQISDFEQVVIDRSSDLFVFHLSDGGFVISTDQMTLSPILAYSFENEFLTTEEPGKGMIRILIHDMKNRIRYQDEATKTRNQANWDQLLEKKPRQITFQQWPPEGTTPTGGWLYTNWTQTQPYNALCPKDGQTGNRSVAGCPATAAAQILNYLKRTNNTRFSDSDDYYHNFGTNNKYWIDNDHIAFDFPSWTDLNVYLDTLEYHYLKNVSLTSADKAALTFACGVAAKQVYSSSVSGTYGIDQAYDAFQRFGFQQSVLVMPDNPSLIQHLAQNIKLALPAHLGLVNPEVTVGHNVVVDGYNTDEFYHFNFGWGGSSNGWYTMPPQQIPYNLTVIEGIVLDIGIDAPPVSIQETISKQLISFCYNQASGQIEIKSDYPESGNISIEVINNLGQVIGHQNIQVNSGLDTKWIKIPQNVYGLLILTARYENNYPVVYKFIRGN